MVLFTRFLFLTIHSLNCYHWPMAYFWKEWSILGIQPSDEVFDDGGSYGGRGGCG